MATNPTNRRANQPIWLEGSVTTFNVTTLFLPGQLGMVYTKDGITYQLVLVKSTSTAVVAGTPVLWQDFDDFVVSAKIADGFRGHPAGIAAGTITAGNYGFIIVDGPGTAITGTGFAAGDSAVMNSTDGSLASVTAGTAPTYAVMGVTTAATVANTVVMYISPPHNSW